MAKETKNLKLHQVTRPEDDSKAFNLETILNENWEKLDSAVGDLSQPVTTAEGSAIGLRVQNGRLQYKNNERWTELGLEYEDIQNLAARSDGLVTWALPQATDNTKIAIVLCRASKDITNIGYAACLADASITKNTLAQNATSNTYTGLTTSTQYWVKAFVKYTLGGKEFYSGGVAVTFTTLAISEVSNLTVNPNNELVTWTLPNGSNHTNVEVCYSKTDISGYTHAQCQSDSNVTKVELASNTTSYTTNVLDKTTYYVKVFLRYSSQYSKGVSKSWLSPKQWYYKSGNEINSITGGWNIESTTDDASFIKKIDYMTLRAIESSSVETRMNRTVCVSTLNLISFLNIKKIKVELEFSGLGGTNLIYFHTNSNPDYEFAAPIVTINQSFSRQIIELDVTNILVSRRIKLKVLANTSDASCEAKIYRVWGES